MTKRQEETDNLLIAQFMNGTYYSDESLIRFPVSFMPELCLRHKLHNLKYHSSWDWLMPVVEKIESIHDKHHGYFGVHISSNTCSIQGTNLWKSLLLAIPFDASKPYGPVYCSDTNAIFDTKIESTWYAVVSFIKWYNKELLTKNK